MSPHQIIRIVKPELMLRHAIRKCDILAGRIGATAFILVFSAVYCTLLNYFGVVLGIAFAWLPAFVAGWATAHASTSIIGAVLRFGVMLQLWHALRARSTLT